MFVRWFHKISGRIICFQHIAAILILTVPHVKEIFLLKIEIFNATLLLKLLGEKVLKLLDSEEYVDWNYWLMTILKWS